MNKTNHIRTTDSSLLLKAIAFAAAKHRDQRRKDFAASAYVNHPIALAEALANVKLNMPRTFRHPPS
jgi:(p)ppGpp synthase/HD superfamily hydrolase